VVFDFAGTAGPRWEVGEATPPFAGPSGIPVEISGTAFVRVRLAGVDAHTAAGEVTVGPDPIRPGGMTALRQIQLVEDFEGVVIVVLGLDTARPFRAFNLARPPRLVVDVFVG
jgi:hypothetical protein